MVADKQGDELIIEDDQVADAETVSGESDQEEFQRILDYLMEEYADVWRALADL